MVKNLPANAGDVGLIPGSGRSLEKEVATHSRTEEPGRLQSLGVTKSWTQLSDETTTTNEKTTGIGGTERKRYGF